MRPRIRKAFSLMGLLMGLALATVACEATDDAEEAADDDADTAEVELPADLELLTSSVGGSYYVVGSAVASILEDDLGIAVTAAATEGSGENIRLLDQGDAELAMIAINALQPASQGEEPFDEKEYDNLRLLLHAYAHPTVFVALANSGLETLSDLDGGRVAVGPGATTWDHISGPMLEAHGVDYEELDRVYAGFGDAFSQLGDGRVDAAIGVVTGSRALIPAAEELAFEQDVVYLEFDPEISAQAIEDVPYYFEAEVDGEVLPGFDGDVYEGIDMGGAYFVVRDDMSDATAHRLTEALHDAILASADDVVFLEALAEDETIMTTPIEDVPFHSGAQQYWEEAGLWQD